MSRICTSLLSIWNVAI
jgi:hypothetical protein